MTTPHNIFFDTTGIEITPAIDRAIKAIIKQSAPSERNIGFLRQYLNEDHITDPKKMVTNEDIKYWLNLPEKV